MVKKQFIKTLILGLTLTLPSTHYIGAMTSSPSEPKLSVETEQFIRQVQKDMGMGSWDIKLEQDPKPKVAWSLHGKSKKTGFLGIDEKYFNSLTEPEKRQVIGHELGHLEKEHTFKGTYFQRTCHLLTWPTICLASAIFPSVKKNLLPLCITNLYFVIHPLQAWYSRKQEQEADLLAARRLNNFQGAMALEHRELHDDEATKSRNFIENTLLYKGLDKLCAALVNDHPSHEGRIAYLEQAAAMQQA